VAVVVNGNEASGIGMNDTSGRIHLINPVSTNKPIAYRKLALNKGEIERPVERPGALLGPC